MTHWMVKVDNALRFLKKAIIDFYQQDKRNFIEVVISTSLNFVFVILILNLVVFPFPTIKPFGLKESTFQRLADIRPLILHAFAALGALSMIVVNRLKPYVHYSFGVVIRIRNYIKFVRDSQRKIQQ